MFRQQLKDFFQFTKGQQRGLIVLTTILFIAIMVRILVPEVQRKANVDFSEFDSLIEVLSAEVLTPEPAKYKAIRRDLWSPESLKVNFTFDPNKVSQNELTRMGLPGYVIKAWINYRNAGAIFYDLDDVKRIYGLDSLIVSYLAPYMKFENVTEPRAKNLPRNGPDIREVSIPIELNGSDSLELTKAWGIGPVFASRIIKYRNLLGGYYDLDQLEEVYGMKADLLDTLKDQLYVDTMLIIKINIRTAAEYQLSRHPYLTKYHSKAIVAYSKNHGEDLSIKQLLVQKVLPPETFYKVRPYLEIKDHIEK